MASSTHDRLTNLFVVALGGGAIGVASWLRPSAAGIGTHEQLGLPACTFYRFTGIPCVSCGMTTAWTWMAHGHPVRAFLTQPMGAVLFLVAAAAVLLSIVCLFAGGTLEKRLAGRGKVLSTIFIVGSLVAWAYKIVELKAR